MNTLPNLIIIGAQKAGTTSLFNWLSQHPEIYGSMSMKDFNFFTDDFYYKELGIEWFSEQFKPKNKQKIIMHGHVNYMYYNLVSLERLLCYKNKYRKDLKLIAILRNPIDRAYSAFWDAKKVALEDSLTFEEAIQRENDRVVSNDFKIKAHLTYVDHGYYFKQLKEFKRAFGTDLKILIFEEFIQNRKKQIKEIFQWLDIEDSFVPDFRKLNESGVPRFGFIQKLVQDISLPKVIKKYVPSNIKGLKSKILREWNIKNTKYPPMKVETREYLKKLYEEDIKELEKLVNKDLSGWLMQE